MDNVVDSDKIPSDGVSQAALVKTLAAKELKDTKAKADALGIKYNGKIGLEKLLLKIEYYEDQEALKQTEKENHVETKQEMYNRLAKESSRLVRVKVHCLNPAKRKYPGSIITVGNSNIGIFRKFVPFNDDLPYHIPHIIYKKLLSKQYQTFVEVKDSRNKVVSKRSVLLNEFNVVVMDPLTSQELDDLRSEQAVNHSID